VATLVEEAPTLSLTTDTVDAVWKAALGQLSDMTVDYAARCENVEFAAPDRLIVSFSNPFYKSQVERPEPFAQIRQALCDVTGAEILLEFRQIEADASPNQPVPKPVSRQQRLREVAREPIVQQAIELFDAEVTDVVDPSSSED